VNKISIIVVALVSCFSVALSQGDKRSKMQTLVERGDSLNGMRVGMWDYFDHPRQLSLRIDYDKGKLVFIRPDTSHFYVRDGEQWVPRKLAIPCRFNGSISSLIDHYDQFSIPYEMVLEKKYFSSWLTFQVEPNGIATNPEVHNDPGYGLKDEILALFFSAPNYWIPGRDGAGKFVTCRMGIRFDFCTTCESNPPFPLKILFTGINPARKGPWEDSSPSFVFSPDNNKLMIMPSKLDASSPNERALIIDLQSKAIQPVPFDHSGNSWWLNNEQILFMPKYYNRTPNVLAILELPTNKITFLSDSTTFSHRLSADRKKLAYITSSNGLYTLYFSDLSTGTSNKILQTDKLFTLESWSPDGRFLMMQIPEGSFIKYLIVNHESGETIQLPLMNARFCGWSLDGSRVYQYKSTSNEYTSFSERERPTQYDGIVQIQTIKTTQYEPIFELFETNFLSGTLPQNLFKKSKNITIRYSASTNRFLLVMDNSAYLLENYSKAKPIKIIEKCSLAEWSNDGNLIAYQNSKDKKLYLYTVATEQTEGLTTVSDKILLKR
jgi:hypothetical protein